MNALKGCGRQLVVGFTCQSPDVRVLPWLFANDVEMHCNNGSIRDHSDSSIRDHSDSSIRDHSDSSIRDHKAGKIPVLDGLWFLACLLGDLHPGSSPARLKLTREHYRTHMSNEAQSSSTAPFTSSHPHSSLHLAFACVTWHLVVVVSQGWVSDSMADGLSTPMACVVVSFPSCPLLLSSSGLRGTGDQPELGIRGYGRWFGHNLLPGWCTHPRKHDNLCRVVC